MSPSPNSKLVQRTIDLNYINKKRSNSIKWIILNAVFLLIFAYDLSCKCPGYTSMLHYVELICAGILAANLIQYALSMIPTRAAKLPLSRDQQKLLGLSSADLDSSFILTQNECSRIRASDSDGEKWPTSDADLSLSPRTWRASASPPSPPSPASPSRRAPSPAHSHSPSSLDTVGDHFFADRGSLADYLRHYEERARAESAGEGAGPARAAPPPVYQLASPDAGLGKLEENSPQGSPQVWWRLDLDPQRLTQWNLNLRLWIHVTILERLVHEIRSADEELARLALCEAGALRGGRVAPARLRALALHVPALAPLLPFLEPFPDQSYVVRRLAELAQGGCLSGYRWDRGGADWDAAKPTDAELVLHVFATYLDGQLAGGGGARPFSAEHVREAGAAGAAGAARRGGGAPAVVRVGARPPHYALALGDETLDVGRGRNNLLHTLLLFLAAAARADPPALARTHLGRAGLNMLWIIGR